MSETGISQSNRDNGSVIETMRPIEKGVKMPENVLDKVRSFLDNYKVRRKNIKRLKQDYPYLRTLADSQILDIFRIYKATLDDRPIEATMFIVGTLLVIISHLHVTVGMLTELSEDIHKPNLIMMNCIIASAAAGLFQIVMQQAKNNLVDPSKKRSQHLLYQFDHMAVCNSMLAGMVSVSSCCSNISLWASLLIGIVGQILYEQTAKLL